MARCGFICLLILTVLLGTFSPGFALETLTMAYRTNERLPLINKAPDSSGLYLDLYTEAAKRLNCKLKVIRKPKKRVMRELIDGTIDFYPGFNFTIKRSGFVFYINNGLPGGDIGVSPPDLPEITDLKQLKGMTLIGPMGGPNFLEGIKGVEQERVAELTIERAFKLIRNNRYDFYIYNKSSLEYYFKNFGVVGIKSHYDCCGGIRPMYLGFSRKSQHIKEEINPDFDPSKPLGPDNFATRLAPNCLAIRLAEVIAQMKQSGVIDKIYSKHYFSRQ